MQKLPGREGFHPTSADLMQVAEVFGRADPLVDKLDCIRHEEEVDMQLSYIWLTGYMITGYMKLGGCLAVWYDALSESPRDIGLPVGGATPAYVLKQVRRSLDWMRGADKMAVALGFESRERMTIWADRNSDLWGGETRESNAPFVSCLPPESW